MQCKPRHVGCLFTFVCLLVAMLSPASAQIIEMRDYHGKQIACAQSGLVGWHKSCGTDDFYSQIFLGNVQTVKTFKAGDFDEFRLVLVPEEVFRGEVPPHFEVTTNQGECLPAFHPGDRWLFYIRTDKGRGPLLAYENESRPIDQAQEAIARLRRLGGLNDAGIMMGRLNWGWSGEQDHEDDLANKEMVVTSEDTGKQYQAFTTQEGRFEFEPLPLGKYQMTLASKGGLWTSDEGEITVKAHACEDYLIKLAPDGMIEGRVTAAGGTPVAGVKLGITNEAIGSWHSAQTDQTGRFVFRGLGPGTFLVGVGLEYESLARDTGRPIYYPGVRSRMQAVPIVLGKAQHRENVDIVLPPGAQ